MRKDFVVFPEHDVAQAHRLCPARASHFEVFTTAHGKEKPEKIILLKCHKERADRGARAHAQDFVDRDALLVTGAAVKVLETSVQAAQEKRLVAHGV